MVWFLVVFGVVFVALFVLMNPGASIEAGRIANLVPWVHRADHLSQLDKPFTSDGSGPPALHLVRFGTALAGTPAQLQPDGLKAFTRGQLKLAGLDASSLWNEAVGALSGDFSYVCDGLYASRRKDGLDLSRLLLTEQIEDLFGGGKAVAIAPNADLLLIADGSNERALRRLVELAREAFEHSQYRSLIAIELDGGVWRDFVPPESVASMFRACRAVSLQRSARDFATFIRHNGEDTPVAHSAALDASAGGWFVSSWVQGTQVLLPVADRIVLIDPNAADPDRRTEVRWDTFVRMCPTAIAPGPVAALVRAVPSQFPSIALREAMRQPERPSRCLTSLGMSVDDRDVESARAAAADLETVARRMNGEDAGPFEAAELLADRATLMPVIRPVGYRESSARSARAMLNINDLAGLRVVKQDPLTWRLGSGEMHIELVHDLEGARVPLTLRNTTVAIAQALKNGALANLEAASLAAMVALGSGVYAGPWDDGFRASRLLLPSVVTGLQVKGEPVAFTPTVDTFIVAGSEDLASLHVALDAAERAAMGMAPEYAWREALSGTPWIFRNGEWKTWQLGSNHAIAARVARLNVTLEASRLQANLALENFAVQPRANA